MPRWPKKEDPAVAVLEEDLPVIEPSQAPEPRKTHTDWNAFVKAKLIPTTIVCDVIYLHPADESCKTRLRLTADSLKTHYESGHGGGFQVKVKQGEGKSWPGWKELEEAGYEVVNLKCEVCDHRVQVSARDILNHLRPHQGKFRGAYQNYRDTFFLQIQNTPVQDDDDSYEDSQF